MILLDTSVLVDAFTGEQRSAPAIRGAIEDGERIAVGAVVLYEWLRGPRTAREREAVEALFPAEQALPFGSAEAMLAARLYAGVARPRGRSMDIALAAHAIEQDAVIWTLNVKDFQDLPGVTAIVPPGRI
ncbi:MAG: type II toxin-antitoxin system VapC family toxin [Thermoanaerobaculia bacterium]